MLRAVRHILPCPDWPQPARRHARVWNLTALATAALVLAGCIRPLPPAAVTAPEISAAPQTRPARAAPIAAPPAPAQVTAYFAAREAQRLSNGLLRRDRAPR
ncbi:MAG: hypothetical protein JJU07_15790, partial [Natronohydrobacter sp.]|nr:hypothetical protein [Natronohydrobacter sp.]